MFLFHFLTNERFIVVAGIWPEEEESVGNRSPQ